MIRKFIVGVSIIFSNSAFGNDLLNFYRIAVEHDPTLQSASAQRSAAVEARPQAVAQLLPQVIATGLANRERIGSVAALTTSTLASNCSGSTDGGLTRCYGNVLGYGLTLSQKLWDWEAFAQLKEANRQAASAEATFVSVQQALLLRVAKAYFAILASSDVLTSSMDQRAAFSSLLEQAKAREQTGVGPRSDVEQAQSFYDATEQGVIDAKNALDDARLALSQIVGMQVTTVESLQDSIPLASPDPASVEDWVTASRRDNPTVLAARLKVEAADYDISVQRGKGLPTLSLTGSSTRTWQNPGLGGDQTADTIGLSVTWPLFQGGANASALRQSRAQYREALADYEATLRTIEAETRSAYRGVVTGIQRISAASRAEQSAAKAVEASKRNVEFATGTEFDLLNAQNLYSAAVRAYSQTRYDYLTNMLTLKQNSGRFGEEDLVSIDSLLVSQGQTQPSH